MRNYIRLSALVILTLLWTAFASGQFNSSPPRNGACFFTDVNYRGESFCIEAGQSVKSVPYNLNDRIRSIRVFGGAQVQFYNDSNFTGVSATTRRDISDLRRLSVPDDRNKNWGGRISSVQITTQRYGRDRGDGRDNRGWERGRDRDRARDWNRGRRNDDNGRRHNGQATVSCSSAERANREWCTTPARVVNVRLVNQTSRNRCELNRTFGIDDGRLWTSYGCSGTFEVR